MTKTIYIGAGHGYNTAGKRTPDDEREWTFNNTVVTSAITHLKANGFAIVRGDDPTGKTDVPLTTRVAKGNNCDLYISVHHNANAGKWFDGGGTETFYYKGSAGSQKIADLVHKETVKAFGERDRGLKDGSHLYEVRESKPMACLLEVGFMDSNQDIKKMRNKTVLENVGKGIAKAVCTYFEQTFKEANQTTQTKPTTTTTETKGLYRVLVDSKQVGAFANENNVLEAVKNHLGKSKTITIEKA